MYPIVPQKTSYDTPEYEEPYLPSSFALRDRKRFDLGPMASQELEPQTKGGQPENPEQLREDAAFAKEALSTK